VRQSTLNLRHLEVDKWSACVTASVIRGEDLAGFFASAVSDEPSGRLGEEVNGKELEEGEGSLEKGGDSPAPC
jgi:hypothetical protein